MSIDFLHNLNGYNVAQLLGTRLHNVDDAAETTLAGQLGASNAGLVIYNTDSGVLKIWDGTEFVTQAIEIAGDMIFKGVVDASATLDGQAEAVAGYQYVVGTAGTVTMTGVTFLPNATAEVGDQILFTATDTAYVIQRNDDEATETTLGNVRLATEAEVLTGTQATEVVTPNTLQAKLDQQGYTRGYFAVVTTTALTPLTVNHGLNLVDKDAFTINVMDSSGNQVNVDVDSTDANNLTITTLLAQTDLHVTVTGLPAAS